MGLPRETKILFLLGLILLNLAVRFPTDGNFREHRVDTFNLHAMADSVEDENEAKWVAHPLSVFGLYPYSYPSLPVFLVAAIAMFTGLSTELSIFVLAQTIGLLGIAAGFVLGSEFRTDFKYRYMMAALISLSPVVAYETIWPIPQRSIFLLEFCMLIWLLLRFRHTQHDKRYLLLMVPVLIAMAATHRMFLLMPALFGSYFLLLIILWLWKRVHLVFTPDWKRELLKWAAVFAWGAALTGALLLQAKRVWFYSESHVWEYYTSGFFFDGTSTRVIFLNAVIDYYSSTSIIAIVGILALAALVRRPMWDGLLFTTLTIAAFAFGLMLGEYMVFIYTPLVAIFVTEGLFEILRLLPRLRPAAVPAMLVLIIMTAGFSTFMTHHWKGIGATPGVGAIPSEDTYSGGLYMKYQIPEGNAVSNDLAIAKRMTAYSRRYCFPVYEVLLPVFDLVDVEELDIRPLSPSELSPNTNHFFRPTVAPEDAIMIMVHNRVYTPQATETIARFDLKYAVVNNNIPHQMEIYGVRKQSPFFDDIHNQRIVIFRNHLITITTLKNRSAFDT